MATGDQTDLYNRLKSLLPKGWFQYSTPVLDSVLYGSATAFSWIYSLTQYTALQTRRVTMTAPWLDLALFDFFGRRIRRKPGQSDASVAAMIETEVLRRRVTRNNVAAAINSLTGSPVKVFEAFNPMDTGGFNAQWALNEPASAIGSTAYPWTMFITVAEPSGAGIPNVAGLDDPQAGLSPRESLPQISQTVVPMGGGLISQLTRGAQSILGSTFSFISPSQITGAVTNQNIYDTINANRAAGITVWTNIGALPITTGRIGVDFAIGVSPIA